MKTKTLIASMAISLALMGAANAGDLATMDGIPAEVMSHADMDNVEGKGPLSLYGNYYNPNVFNPRLISFNQYYGKNLNAAVNLVGRSTGFNTRTLNSLLGMGGVSSCNIAFQSMGYTRC